MKSLSVHLLPALFEPEELHGETVVVIDILRATTSMTHALANGARQIVPCLTVEDAVAAKSKYAPDVLLGGERGGVRIDGFDLSNSPDDYSAANVANQTIVFTTTNGTKALLKSRQAQDIFVGCFANLSAVADLCRRSQQNVHLVCAGTNGKITNEDALFAGAIVDLLSDAFAIANDSARLAQNLWLAANAEQADGIHTVIRESYGGSNLRKLGYDRDIRTAADIDTLTVVGRYDGTAIRSTNPSVG